MTTALNQVREFLQVDRLVIYQFEESATREQGSGIGDQGSGIRIFNSSPAHSPSFDLGQHSGWITYEVCATDLIGSVLNYKEENCFLPTSQCWEKYR